MQTLLSTLAILRYDSMVSSLKIGYSTVHLHDIFLTWLGVCLCQSELMN